jgi:alginate O-acetyltransferase complex protein AlgI
VAAISGGGAAEPPAGFPAAAAPFRFFNVALWLTGIGHFVVLIASVQVPARMRWQEDLAKLTPANRKLMWTYGAFIVLTIIAFGTLTLVLHDELLAGDRAALGLATFIGCFWLLRVIIDFGYHTHADWPQGTRFIVAHVLLTTLFIALTATYLGLVAWHGLRA